MSSPKSAEMIRVLVEAEKSIRNAVAKILSITSVLACLGNKKENIEQLSLPDVFRRGEKS
jgi:hypothetical protein